MSEEDFKPPVFNTIGPKLKAHFEKYNGDAGFENGEPITWFIKETSSPSPVTEHAIASNGYIY